MQNYVDQRTRLGARDMNVGDLIRWNRDGLDGIVHMPWFKKQGIVIEVDDDGKCPSVVTVLWDIDSDEKIFADELEVVNESR